MHPHVSFEEKNIKSLVLPDGTVIDKTKQEDWRRRRNTLANLQIMEGKDNARKNDTPLNDWLSVAGNKDNAKYLPQNISYDLSNFDQFMEERQKLMSQELKKILL